MPYRYDAFMSYSHSSDALLAPELQRLIRRVSRPWYSRGTLRIFRDQTNLRMSESLWGSIEAGLMASESFVLMASPAAAGSPWVDREVRFWRENRSRSTFSIVLTDGDIRWDGDRADFDWAKTTALPRSLSGWFDDEPLWSDVRPLPGVLTHRDQRNDRLRDAARTIAAPLYGLEKDQLDGEDERESRRRQRTLRGGIAALSVLTVLALLAAVIAFQQRGVALAQRDAAISNRLLTTADLLQKADQSLAAQLDVEAYRLDPGPEARTRLVLSQGAPLSRALSGPTGGVGSVAFSPDGHTLAAAGNGVWLWNMAARPPSPLGKPLTGPSDQVAFSRTGHLLAAAGGSAVWLWDIRDPARPHRVGPALTGPAVGIVTIALSPDGRTLAAGGNDRTVWLWNITNPAQPTSIEPTLTGPNYGVLSVAFSPDGHTLAASAYHDTVWMWNMADPAHPAPLGRSLIESTHGVASIAFSPDGQLLAAGTLDNKVWLCDVTNPAKVSAIGGPLTGPGSDVNAVAFSPDGRTLAAGSADHTVWLWNVTVPMDPVLIGAPLTDPTNGIDSVAFSPNGHTLAAGATSSDNASQQAVRLWDLPPVNQVAQGARLGPQAFSQNGRTLAAVVAGAARLWDVTDLGHPTPISGSLASPIASVAFSPTGNTLATDGGDGKVWLWDATDPRATTPIGRQPLTAPTGPGGSMMFSSDGRTLLVAGNTDAWLWDVRDPRRPHRFAQPLSPPTGISSAAISPDGSTVALSTGQGPDWTVRLWSVVDPAHPTPTGMELAGTVAAVSSIAFSPDGHTLAVGIMDGTVRLWNITQPAQPVLLTTLTGPLVDITSVAFSPDGHTLAAGTGDGTENGAVWLWDVADARHANPTGAALSDRVGTVDSVGFSPDGRALSADVGPGRLWNMTPDAAITRICAATGRSLPPQAWQLYVPELPATPLCGG